MRTDTGLGKNFLDGALSWHWKEGRDQCFLAQFDPERNKCAGRIEAAHLINRQRVRARVWAMFGLGGGTDPVAFDYLCLAEWDPRNGAPACTHHHRRFDGHRTPELRLPADALPAHFWQFVADWGLETDAEDRYGKRTAAAA